MDIRELRLRLGDTQGGFARRYGIPFRTVQNWESGIRKPPEYVMRLLERRIQEDLVNRRTAILPIHDSGKALLPKRSDFLSSLSWLHAIQDHIGTEIVFALDEALMCHGSFLGRVDEGLVWLYGNDSLSQYNGVVLLGNHISSYQVKNRDGLYYTDFNRTVNDALANEHILDMQGITEALSNYYYSNGESMEGISVAPIYQERFELLARDAIDYYND
ncbi:MAG: helix-turn-helix domain-containing protein [Clostridia bacterium]|nr:helix-turn-helix domain-containing protein [Clostridia bacterium]